MAAGLAVWIVTTSDLNFQGTYIAHQLLISPSPGLAFKGYLCPRPGAYVFRPSFPPVNRLKSCSEKKTKNHMMKAAQRGFACPQG